MKVLILGCNGMAGHMVAMYFSEHAHDVTGFARSKSKYLNTIVGDARNVELLGQVIMEGNYDAVINCIGVLNKAAEYEKENAVFLNALLPHLLVGLTKDSKTKVVQISTDCVFSGKRGNYTENDLRDGTTFYDRTKALGELEDNKNITLRNSIVGPDMNSEGIGLLNWFLHQKGEVKGFRKVIWTGLTTLQMAKVIEEVIKQDVCGVIHAVPKVTISKYDLLRLFNQYFKNNEIVIIPDDSIVLNKSLVRTYRRDFQYDIPDYEQMVFELSGWVNRHSYLYPQYNK